MFQFKAVGVVYGKYLPGDTNPRTGNLFLGDGLFVPSCLLLPVDRFLSANPDLAGRSHYWLVYPFYKKVSEGGLNFVIKALKIAKTDSELERLDEELDVFKINGITDSVYGTDSKIQVNIYKNNSDLSVPTRHVIVTHDFPGVSSGQLWEFTAERKAGNLIAYQGCRCHPVNPESFRLGNEAIIKSA